MQSKNRVEKNKKRGIHWNAMGAGLFTASLVYPEQQMLLISMGCSSVIMGIVDKLDRQRHRTAMQQ